MWLKLNGVSIYGTRAGCIPPSADIVSTSRGDVHYAHLLNYVSDTVALAQVPETVQKARLVRDGSPLAFERDGAALRITIPETLRDPFDTVIELC